MGTEPRDRDARRCESGRCLANRSPRQRQVPSTNVDMSKLVWALDDSWETGGENGALVVTAEEQEVAEMEWS